MIYIVDRLTLLKRTSLFDKARSGSRELFFHLDCRFEAEISKYAKLVCAESCSTRP